jgi:membrane protein implicated in regulation of membrane protease activity
MLLRNFLPTRSVPLIDTPSDEEYTTNQFTAGHMETFFLACFAFGALFTLASLVLGAVGGLHFGNGAAHVGHVGTHVGHVHLDASHGAHASHNAHVVTSKGDSSLPLLNASSVVGALTWFGAAGYVLLRLADWSLLGIIIGALAAGAVGWYVIARFLAFVLKGEVEMNPDDYRLEGTVGQITVGIPAGGTGEVVFTKAEVRRSEAARAVGGTPIPRGTEVVITSYAKGFATVQPWAEFLAEREQMKLAPAQENREA